MDTTLTLAAEDLASGKGSTDENFPVASALIAARHRAVVMAFYRFARAADDVADNALVEPATKLAVLEALRASLQGETDEAPEGRDLRVVLRARALTPQHALDLLEAFRRDVTKLRYDDWDDLMDYCRYSAAPVGRFVLDVHGESPALWPMNDALCAALQVINHLQDCGKDRREIDRVYIPLDQLRAAGLTRQTQALLDISRPFARAIKDGRLALEVGVIQALAEDLCRLLLTRDPLSQEMHHDKPRMAMLGLSAMARTLVSRLGGKR
jgi:phytoene/squalene synthetase